MVRRHYPCCDRFKLIMCRGVGGWLSIANSIRYMLVINLGQCNDMMLALCDAEVVVAFEFNEEPRACSLSDMDKLPHFPLVTCGYENSKMGSSGVIWKHG